MRYRVELDELIAFVDRLQSFEQRAEAIAAGVDGQIAALNGAWAGNAATAHRAQHDQWMAGAAADARGARAASERRRQRASALHRRRTAERGNVVVTIQDVDPETYYAVGKGLFEKAGKLYDAFNVNVSILGGTGPWRARTTQARRGQPRTTSGSGKSGRGQRSDQGDGELRRRRDPGRIQPRRSRTQRHTGQPEARAGHAARACEYGRRVVGTAVSRRAGPGPGGRHRVDAAGGRAGTRR